MTSAQDVAEALAAESATDQRILKFAALLGAEAQTDVIVVGGSAIEIYTRGGYVSGDIDLVGSRSAIRRVLSEWGFVTRGRVWVHEGWKLVVDLVGEVYTGDRYRLSTVVTSFGPVRLAALEDLIIKRLAEAKHWQVQRALQEAALVWRAHGDALDQTYLDLQARRYEVTDILRDLRRTIQGQG